MIFFSNLENLFFTDAFDPVNFPSDIDNVVSFNICNIHFKQHVDNYKYVKCSYTKFSKYTILQTKEELTFILCITYMHDISINIYLIHIL